MCVDETYKRNNTSTNCKIEDTWNAVDRTEYVK